MKKIITVLSAFLLFLSVAIVGAFVPTMASAEEKNKVDILYLEYYVDAGRPNGYTFYVEGDWTLNNPAGVYNKFAPGIIVKGEKDGEEVIYTSHETDFYILDGLDLYFQNKIRLFFPVGSKAAPDEEGIMTSGMLDKITSITIEAGFDIRTANSETRTTKTFVPKTGYIDENTEGGTLLLDEKSCTVDENAPEFEMGFLSGKYYSTTWEEARHHYLFEIDFEDTDEIKFTYQSGLNSAVIPRGSVIINDMIDLCDISATFYSSEPYRENRVSLYIYPNQGGSLDYDLSKIESIEFKAGFNFMTNNWRNFRESELKQDYKFVAMSTFDNQTGYSVPFYLDQGTTPVVFYGFNDSVLEVQNVKKGEAALAPEAPAVEGYQFVRWDKDFDNIQGVTHVYAVYEAVSEEVEDNQEPQTNVISCASSLGGNVLIIPILASIAIIAIKKNKIKEDK